MRLAVIAPGDPLDVKTWSGTPYFMTMALQSEFQDVIPIRTPYPSWWKIARRAARKSTGGTLELAWIKSAARIFADRIAKKLDSLRIDVAVCVASAPLSAYLAARLPVVHVSDATVPLMRDYYSEFSSLPNFFAERALQLDRASVAGARACLYPTKWAARSAAEDYGADPSRIHAIPWGCNLQKRDLPQAANHERGDQCNLVFIGVDWKRKGGDIVIDAFEQLLGFGCQGSLDIIGAQPDLSGRLDGLRKSGFHIREHGFINKNSPQGMALFQSIMQKASFLFVPTRQDCYGLVFAEASAYGVPVMSTRTGGVPEAVEEGVNGHLLGTDATAKTYAELIYKIWSDPDYYSRLRVSSRQRFEQHLNWDRWIEKAAPIITEAGK